ncbi:MAG: LAGLIDADG family homing endonuclease [Candidatus Thorarchaeota archaeon]
MPPSFAPKERRKKRETRPPSDRKSADDIVKDIEREYRDLMRERGLVDNWGQPIKKLDKKKLKQDVQKELEKEERQEKQAIKKKTRRSLSKSVAASLSEAIGKRLAEEKPKKESSDSAPTSKKERSLGEDRKPKTSSESLKEGHDVRKRLKRYKVSMYEPQIRDVKFKTGDSLTRYIDQELNGMKHLPNFDKIKNDALAQMMLRELVGTRRTLALNEIRSLSEQVKLPFRTTRHYVGKKGRPEFYRLAEKAITRSEAQSILSRIQLKLGGIRSHSDVEDKLKENGVLDHLRTLSSHERDKGMVQKYFSFLDALSEGGIMRDIARRVGVSDGTGITWTKGVFPSYIKRALGLYDSGTSTQRKHKDTSTDIRLAGKIRMKRPEIMGVPIKSEKHLKSIVTKEFQGMMDMPGADKMFHEACVQLRIMDRLKGREYLEYGELRRLEKEFGVDRRTIGIWTKKGVTPRFYFHIERSISKSEALEQLKTVKEWNTGLITMAEYERRMGNYYLRDYELNARFSKRETAITKRYFQFMENYCKGGPFAHIARQADVPPSTALGWLKGLQPRHIRIASQIPKDAPKSGHLWLPLKMTDGKYPSDFIEVPTRISSYRNILPVLHQLTPIESEYMHQLADRLSRRSIEEEFMYLLGAYISDGSSFNRTTNARSFGIRLARRYPWSVDFGDGMCQALGACGIYAQRNENTHPKKSCIKTSTGLREIHHSEMLNWASENSPLLHWIHRTCLGYNDLVPKREQKVTADWILDSPFPMRRAVLQGLGDGDGSASVQGNYVCISSVNNKQFVERLLQSFGISTRRTERDVVTSGTAEAIKAAQIPLFRYSSSRLDSSKRILQRNEAKRSVRDSPLKSEEITYIIEMKRKGMTAWQATEAFFDHSGTAIDKRVVERIFRKRSFGDEVK